MAQSLQPFKVLHDREVTLACCQVQWCTVLITPRLLVTPLLAQVLHHREVTNDCCQEQWCPTILTARLQFHLRSLLHCLHNVQLSRFAGLKKAITMRQLLCLVTATQWISQVQLPSPRIDVSHEELPAQRFFGREHVK